MDQTLQSERTPLTLEGVSFGYGAGRREVSGVTAALGAGRLTALIGPNAAGKTTLLRLMLGQLEPAGGVVRLGGRRVSAMAPRERARVMSYVPQRGGVSFGFSVGEVVAMGRYSGGRDDAGVSGAMAACEVSDLAGRPFAELSGGQQQRVLVARAMAQVGGAAGRVMLLDEPSSHMDLRHQHALMRLLREQAGAGAAVLIVLHDLNLAAGYADDVWLMDGGELVAAGEWAGVLTRERLERVYGVGLRVVESAGRPVFVAEPGGTLAGRT